MSSSRSNSPLRNLPHSAVVETVYLCRLRVMRQHDLCHTTGNIQTCLFTHVLLDSTGDDRCQEGWVKLAFRVKPAKENFNWCSLSRTGPTRLKEDCRSILCHPLSVTFTHTQFSEWCCFLCYWHFSVIDLFSLIYVVFFFWLILFFLSLIIFLFFCDWLIDFSIDFVFLSNKDKCLSTMRNTLNVLSALFLNYKWLLWGHKSCKNGSLEALILCI